MELTLKTCLSVASLIGAICSVGVPVAMYSGKAQSSDITDVGSQVSESLEHSSPRGGQLDKNVDLSKCGAIVGNSIVSFGEKAKGPICWKVKELAEDQTKLSEISDSVTDLFKKMWYQGSGNWSSQSNSVWTSRCVNSSKGWLVVTSQGNTHEYLGYCDNSNPSKDSKELSFLDINKSNSKVSEVKVCWKNCWSDNSSDSIKQLQNPASDKWQIVEFYSNESK